MAFYSMGLLIPDTGISGGRTHELHDCPDFD